MLAFSFSFIHLEEVARVVCNLYAQEKVKWVNSLQPDDSFQKEKKNQESGCQAAFELTKSSTNGGIKVIILWNLSCLHI